MQFIKLILYLSWSMLYAVLCFITLPIHLGIYIFCHFDSFSIMTAYIDMLTIKIFGE